MDPASIAQSLLGPCRPVFALLLKSGFNLTERRGHINVSDKTRREWKAKIDEYVGGDDKKTVLIEVRKLMEEGRTKLYHDLAFLSLQGNLQSQYTDIKTRLAAAQQTMDTFNDFQDKPNWDNVEQTSVAMGLDDLLNWIKEDSVNTPNMMASLIRVCSMDQFQQWKFEISRLFIQSYSLQVAHFQHKYIDSSSKGFSLTSHDESVRQDVLNKVQFHLNAMKENAQLVTDALEEAYQHVKARFLDVKCPDTTHKKCGAGYEEGCCMLAAKIYPELEVHHLSPVSNSKRAVKIADILAKAYPQFRWSVIVMDDQEFVERHHHERMYVRRFGTVENRLLPGSNTRDNYTKSASLGDYGDFLCYRVTATTRKAAVVLWADPDVLADPELIAQSSSIKTKWDNALLEKRVSVGQKESGHAVEEWLQSNGFGSAFTVGVRAMGGEKIGFSWMNKGMALVPPQPGTPEFPLLLGDSKACMLVWPKLAPPTDTFGCPVEEGRDELSTAQITLAGNTKYTRVLIGKCSDSRVRPQGTEVVIKKAPISVQVKEQQKEATELLSKFFRKLVSTEPHENVVQLLGFQPVPGFFQIVMEHCQGGSLTERVKAPVTLRKIHEWTLDIVKGMTYLHNVIDKAHKNLEPDHIMFAGPEFGEGQLKIISVGRTADILKPVNRSHRTPASRGLFQPREACVLPIRTGSKTDIYSLGGIVIQMITGNAPDVVGDREGLDFRLDIPANIPAQLAALIQDCVQDNYEMRPYSAELRARLEGDRKKYYDAAWTCPNRTYVSTHSVN